MIQTLQAGSGASYRVIEGPSSMTGVASFDARNAAHAFSTQFDGDGLTIQADVRGAASSNPLGLRLARYGSPETSEPISMQPWTAGGLRVERTSADPARPLVEWYVNGSLGLEQGFTVAAPPDGTTDALVLEIAVGDGWTARSLDEGAIALEEIDGPGRLRYGHLAVVDALGTTLSASMTTDKRGIVLQVATTDARYPVTVDPIVQQAQLTASDGAASDNFGISVAVSGDTAVVGAYLDDVGASGNQGSAYVFVRSGTSWSQQAQLTASDGGAGRHSFPETERRRGSALAFLSTAAAGLPWNSCTPRSPRCDNRLGGFGRHEEA